MSKFVLMKILPKLAKEFFKDAVSDKTLGFLNELAKFHLYLLIAILGLAAFAYIVTYFIRRFNGAFSLDYSSKMSASDYRKAFILNMLMYIILIVIMFAIAFKFANLPEVEYMSTAEMLELLFFGIEILGMLLVIIIFSALSFIWSMRRLNDMGKSRFWILLLFIPVVNLFVFVKMFFTKGETESQSGENVLPFSQSMLSKVFVGVVALSIALNGVFEIINSGTPHTTPNDIMLGHKLIHGNWNAVDQEQFYIALDEINGMPYEVVSVARERDNTIVSLAVDNSSGEPVRLNMTFNANDWFYHMRLDNLTSGASKDFYNDENAYSNHLSRNIDYLMLGFNSYTDQMMYIDTSAIEINNANDDSNMSWKVNIFYSDGYSITNKTWNVFEINEGRPCMDLGGDIIYLDVPSNDSNTAFWQMEFLLSYYYAFGHKYGS